jgi:hypothetical protein
LRCRWTRPACNPSYSGGRDQEDSGSKSAWANSSERIYLGKNIHKNRAAGVAQGEGPEFKSQYLQKKKRLQTEGIHFPCPSDWCNFLQGFFPEVITVTR